MHLFKKISKSPDNQIGLYCNNDRSPYNRGDNKTNNNNNNGESDQATKNSPSEKISSTNNTTFSSTNNATLSTTVMVGYKGHLYKGHPYKGHFLYRCTTTETRDLEKFTKIEDQNFCFLLVSTTFFMQR